MKNKSRSDHLRISHVVCLAVLTCATAELDTLHPPHWNQPPRGALATVKLPLQTGSLFFSVMWVNWKSILYWRRDSTKGQNSKLHGSKLMHSWWWWGGTAEMAEPRNERERRKWLLKEFWKKTKESVRQRGEMTGRNGKEVSEQETKFFFTLIFFDPAICFRCHWIDDKCLNSFHVPYNNLE